MRTMRTREIAALGKRASVISMGSTYFGSAMPDEEVFEVLDAFCALGGSFIDTARAYGEGAAERVIGKWMRARGNREKLVLDTKGGYITRGKEAFTRLSRTDVLGHLQASLEALDTGYVDLYWLHRDDPARPVGELVETANALLETGRVRLIGASNWSPERLREARSYALSHGLRPFDADQPQWSLAQMMTREDDTLYEMDEALYAWHAETGMPCMAYSSQAKGFFIKLDTLGEEGLSEKSRRRYLCPGNLKTFEALREMSRQTGRSVGALALAYLTSQPFPVYPIVGVSRVSQVEALREAGETVLTPDQVRTLHALRGEAGRR